MPWNKDGSRKTTTYKMKYNNSAFPFKSPLKHSEKEHKAEHEEEKTTLSKKLKEFQKKINYPGTEK